MPLKIKNMKGIDFSCASPASTAICSSTDQHFMVKNTTKSINRLNSYLNNHYKTFTNNINNNNNNNNTNNNSPRAPCISELPFTPRFSSSYREKTRKKTPSIVKHSDITPRRKSTADISDFRRYYEKCSFNNNTTFSPPRGNSSRYLLGESRFLDSLCENNHQNNNVTKNSKCDAWALVPSTPIVSTNSEEVCEKKSFGSFLEDEKEKKINKSLAIVNQGDPRVIKSSKYGVITKYVDDGHSHQLQKSNLGYGKNDSLVLKKNTNRSTRTRDHQVVVLRVSLHCRGCEGKLRKHLSKMEGVTSFSIDLETKKVTVIGNVTPLGVLTSISKVKNAQFWPSQVSTSPSSSSSSSLSNSSTMDFK